MTRTKIFKNCLYCGKQLDGNKQNNDILNLCLLSSCGEHSRLHKQLESVALELLKEGIICFDYDQKLYKIKKVK